MEKIIGIDFGTSNSCLAVVDGDRPVLIPNDEGDFLTPSVISFLPNGEYVIGKKAKQRALTHPLSTVSAIKKLIGVSYSNLKDIPDQFSFSMQEGPEDSIEILIDNQSYSVPEIVSFLLRDLADQAENYLAEQVKEIILTVPVHFDNLQIQALQKAVFLAGLRVRRLIRESTAASLYLGYLRKNEEQLTFVYDMGGGSLDISIIESGNGVFEVKAATGHFHLGGRDFDKRIAKWLADYFLKTENVDLWSDPIARFRLEEVAEKAKIALSESQRTPIELPFISVNGQIRDLATDLGLATLRALCIDLVHRSLQYVQDALERSFFHTKSEFTEIVLVGSAAKMPLIQEEMSLFFGREVMRGEGGEFAVALGGAIQGGVIGGFVEDVLLLDSIPYSLGIQIDDEAPMVVFQRDLTIPYKRSIQRTLNKSNTFQVTILQSYDVDLARSIPLDRFRVRFHGPPEGAVFMGLDIDTNGAISFFSGRPDETIDEIEAHPPQKIQKYAWRRIEAQVQFSESHLIALKEKQRQYKQKKQLEQKVQKAILAGQGLLDISQSQAALLGKHLDTDAIAAITGEIASLEQALKERTPEVIEQCIARLHQHWQIAAQHLYLKGISFPRLYQEDKLEKLNQVRAHLSDGDLAKAIHQFSACVPESQFSDIHRDLLHLSAQLQEVTKRRNLNLISYEDYSLQFSQISYALLASLEEALQKLK